MNIKKLQIVKSDERGIIYDCGKVGFIIRSKGTISADHTHEEPEILYLVEGRATLTIGKEVSEVEAPVEIEISGNVYHKLVALTDIRIVREG
jgi:quercetin dioxygenase-like cupin family protein